MGKKNLFLPLVCLLFRVAAAQSGAGFDYGNAWYDAAKPYVKMRVAEDGVYRVYASSLDSMGWDTTGINPDNYQVFYRGVEQYIFVKKNGSALDYIEFYGQRNDGRVDSTMYRNPNGPYYGRHDGSIMPNIRFSNFTDTSAYFLTAGNQAGLRVADADIQNYGSFASSEPWFRYEALKEYFLTYLPGGAGYFTGGGSIYNIYHPLNSDYTIGEGYVGDRIEDNSNTWVSFPTPDFASSGNPSEYAFRVVASSSYNHILDVQINGVHAVSDSNFGIYIKTLSGNFNGNLPATTDFVFNGLGSTISGTPDNYYLCWASMEYDRLCRLNFSGTLKIKDWYKPVNAYFAFDDTDIQTEGWIWDLSTHQRIHGLASGDTLKIIVPGAASVRQLFLVSDKSVHRPLLENHWLHNLSDTSGGAEFVIIANKETEYTALKYENYRDTNTVNPLTARVVLTEEIYDEFGYGSITPLAIKRFCKWAMDHWAVKPRYFLLWGKGHYLPREHEPQNAVLTWGYPPCDYEYVSNFDPDTVDITPRAAIGRVCVETQTDGENYLEKADIYEHTAWQPWMKEGLFLGGGENLSEQQSIFQSLMHYRQYFEGMPLGGQGWYQQKYNTDFIRNTDQTVTQTISAGIGLVHFFGHSSANIYEIDIQEPYNYSNWERIPLMIAFGCYGGDFTVKPGRSFGEKFVLEKKRGSIGYLANSTAGFLPPLASFGDALYPHLYDDMIGQPIGDIVKKAIEDFTVPFPGDQYRRNHGKQLNYQGDPAIRIFTPAKPDLEINATSFFLNPSTFSASDTEFYANIVVNNFGRVLPDSFWVHIRQQSPQSVLNYAPQRYAAVYHRDTLVFIIRNSIGNAMAGMNTFEVFVDSDSSWDEYDENNNEYTYSVFIPGNVPAILYPYDFAVIDSPGVTLSASSYVISQTGSVNYLFEIDTVPDFNSPRFSSSGNVVGSPWYVKWDVPFVLEDSQVYYWRVRLTDILPPGWARGSFKYIQGKRGWAQSKPPQFYNDPSQGVSMNPINRTWEFDSRSAELHAFCEPLGAANYRLNNGAFKSVANPSPLIRGVMYTAIDQHTLEPYFLATPNSGGLGDWTFAAMPGNAGQLVNAIQQTRFGDYFLIVSQNEASPQQWPLSVFNALKQIGCSQSVDSLRNGYSFILLGKKGYPGWAKEVLMPNLIDPNTGNTKLDLLYNLKSTTTSGEILSSTVGPSVKWNELICDWKSLDNSQGDIAKIFVYVHPVNGGPDSLVMGPLDPGTYSLSFLDANAYPELRLSCTKSDSIFGTAPQLAHWHVLYDPAPEAVVDMATNFVLNSDTLEDGAAGNLKLHLFSVTGTDFSDSMRVRYIFEKADRSQVPAGDLHFAPLRGDSAYDFQFDFSTLNKGLEGPVKLIAEVNPDNDQPELYHFNNYYSGSIFVVKDKINPLLDVTFDGKRIQNEDIVSPLPEIRIHVNDENHYYAVNDTSFEVYFGPGTDPASVPRIFIDNNARMEKIPAVVPGDNKAQLVFRPDRLADGLYSLRVKGFDGKGNASGKGYYDITFRVVNENSVTNVLNYPNPFSTCTRWVYTLTGAEKPDIFKIRIFTVSGKFVKEIDLLQEGEMHTGYNITESCWDGTDEFGDKLANGVYVYQVLCRRGEDELKVRDEGISEYFKNGFGKLYIMR